MNLLKLVLISGLCAGGVNSFASPPTWSLLWSDEFNLDGPVDTSRWRFETGTGTNGWGNNELEYYTDRPQNAYCRNGNLEIAVRRQDTAGKRFTSARLITLGRFSFQYGKVEARIKVLAGKGMWPAFWMMGASFPSVGWPGCGEIDVMEVMDRGGALDSRVALATAHWLYDANNTHAQYGGSDTSDAPLADSFHVYGVTWDRQYLRAFIDGRQYWVMDIAPQHCSEFHQPFFLLLNAAVGGSPLGISDPAQVTAILPQTMLVDYVRVYQEKVQVVATSQKSGTPGGITMRYRGRCIRAIPVSGRTAGSPVRFSLRRIDGKEVFRQQDAARFVDLPAQLRSGVYLVTIGSRTLPLAVRQ